MEKRIITFDDELEENLKALVECCPEYYLVRGILQMLYANGEKVTDSANEGKYELKLCAQCNTMKNIEKPFSVCQRCVDGMSNKELLNKQWHDGYYKFMDTVRNTLKINKSGRRF